MGSSHPSRFPRAGRHAPPRLRETPLPLREGVGGLGPSPHEYATQPMPHYAGWHAPWGRMKDTVRNGNNVVSTSWRVRLLSSQTCRFWWVGQRQRRRAPVGVPMKRQPETARALYRRSSPAYRTVCLWRPQRGVHLQWDAANGARECRRPLHPQALDPADFSAVIRSVQEFSRAAVARRRGV